MQLGIMHLSMDQGIDEFVAAVKTYEAEGFPSVWAPNIFGLDAITALSIAGRETERIELGTAVVPTFPRHPFAIAQQALTAAAASQGRFVLGIGLSHKLVIENMMGLSYDKPARHMREYLEALTPLLRGEPVKFEGELYRVAGAVQVPGVKEVPLIVAALGDIMLGLAGKFAQGTITWMTGVKTLDSHILPKLRKAAAEASRPDPRVVAGVPVALTNDIEGAREFIAKTLQMYGMLPSYRAMLDREGAAGPADVALLGDEAALRAGIERYRDAGVTDFGAATLPVEKGASERTREFLRGLL